MESQNKLSMDGIVRSDVKAEVSERRLRTYNLLLRILGLAFTLVAAVVGGVNRETQVIAISIVETLPPLHIPVTAKWYYTSAFVYFVVSNAVACSYAAASLVLSLMSRSSQTGIPLVLLILDLIMVALLFSANGAAAAVGVIGLNGNSHVNWNKVCNVVRTFCRHSMASVVMSMLGSFVFLWLVLLATSSIISESLICLLVRSNCHP